jgi:hypothetical protein
MVADARYNTISWINGYYTPANATDDDGNALGMQTMYEGPEYPMTLEFKEPSVIDVIVAIGQPESTPLIRADQKIYGYKEHVPIKIFAVNKTSVTAVKAIWQVETELRRIAETYPEGSKLNLENRRSADKVLGSTTLYGSEWVLNYKRGTT